MNTVFQPRVPANKDACISKVGQIYRVTVRLMKPDGSTFRKSSDRKTVAEARKLRDRFFEEFNIMFGGREYARTLVARAGGLTCSQFRDQLFAGPWSKVEDKHIRQTRQIIDDYMLPELGTLPLRSITVADLRRTLEALAGTQIVRHHSAKSPTKGYPSLSTLKHWRAAVSSFFNHAVEEGLVDLNPMSGLKVRWEKLVHTSEEDLDEAPDHEKLLTAEERAALLEASKGTAVEAIVRTMHDLGLRPSEALALRRQDFDLDREVVRIGRAVKTSGSIGRTKTGVTREIPLPDELIEYIRGLDLLPASFLSQNRAGTHFEFRKFARLFDSVVTAAKLGRRVTSYSLRHSWCSRMINENGGSIPDVAALAGHSPQVLLAHYAHSSAESRVALMKGKKTDQGQHLLPLAS